MDNNFSSTEISTEINSAKAPMQSDSLLFKKAEQEDFEHRKQYDKRDNLYSELLEEYISVYKSKSKRNRKLKLAFFIIAVITFCVIILGAVASMVIVAIKGGLNISGIAVVVGSVANILSAIIVLPKIIAEHLFPTDEEQNMNEMIKNMQENDAKIRALFQKNQNGPQK